MKKPETGNDLPPQSGEITKTKPKEEIARLEEKAQREMEQNVVVSPDLIGEEAVDKLAGIEKQKQSVFGKLKSALDSVRARLAGFKGGNADLYKAGLQTAREQKGEVKEKLTPGEKTEFDKGYQKAKQTVAKEKKEGSKILRQYKKEEGKFQAEAAFRSRIEKNRDELERIYGDAEKKAATEEMEEEPKDGMKTEAELEEEPYAEHKVEVPSVQTKETAAAMESLDKQAEERDNLDQVVEAYEEAENMDKFTDYLLKTSDYRLTQEKVKSDKKIEKYLQKIFKDKELGTRFEDFVMALPEEQDYVNLALGQEVKEAERNEEKTEEKVGEDVIEEEKEISKKAATGGEKTNPDFAMAQNRGFSIPADRNREKIKNPDDITVGAGEFKTVFKKGEKVLYSTPATKGKRASTKEYTVVGPSRNKLPGLILTDGKRKFALSEDAVINRVEKK